MKRGSEKMDINEEDMIIGSKRRKEANEPLEFGFSASDSNVEMGLQNTFVERNSNPVDFSLSNANYLSEKTLQQDHEMEFEDNIIQVTDDSKDTNLHLAACNFLKKPGQVYHLYERPCGQKYFSMLSPQDWGDKAPHKFLGSWFLENNQSWTPVN
ncbi:unnamed protein product [Ceutorhynchus assimilis]|uniref:Uncharacterized protein n=1 Tax=Ceutorhynchus assimilis TaxID=467358 RepID=A0A9N9QS95_9CUCU|nr:unnamed protein product [Ceutorhynchus assimilis]